MIKQSMRRRVLHAILCGTAILSATAGIVAGFGAIQADATPIGPTPPTTCTSVSTPVPEKTCLIGELYAQVYNTGWFFSFTGHVEYGFGTQTKGNPNQTNTAEFTVNPFSYWASPTYINWPYQGVGKYCATMWKDTNNNTTHTQLAQNCTQVIDP